jgi:hypothetical protein
MGFRQTYWRFASERYPRLGMSNPGTRAFSSNWVWFKPLRIPEGVRIRHKLKAGKVDFELSGLGPQTDAIEALLRKNLPLGVTVQRASKSAVLRSVVPSIDPSGDFDSQSKAAKHALDQLTVMYDWLVTNRSIIEGLLQEK